MCFNPRTFRSVFIFGGLAVVFVRILVLEGHVLVLVLALGVQSL